LSSPVIDVRAARERIRPHVLETPLVAAPLLSERCGRPVHLKLESLQHTGSFKIRGAASRMTALTPEEASRGVVTCSSGNHGRAVAHMAAALGLSARVCVPDWVDPVKLAAIEAAGAEAVLAGPSYDEADRVAHSIAAEEGRVFVHPFDDPQVAAGQGTLQGTLALEILEQLPEAGEIAASLSGGGLVGGIAVAVGETGGGPRVSAVTAEAAGVMLASLQAGHPVELPEEPTLAGALAGGIGLENRVTFPLIRDLIRDHIIVTEHEIRDAMCFAYRDLSVTLEGGGAVPLAAALSGKLPGDDALVLVLSGGNVDLEVLERLLA
jgi:threonine dehydratase